MARSFGIVEEKLREADFFLNQLCRSSNLSFEARCFFSAFVSAARSVTLTMQASLKGVRDFDQWYEEIRSKLKTDRLAPHFVEIRNDIVHIGINPLNQSRLNIFKNIYHGNCIKVTARIFSFFQTRIEKVGVYL